MPDYKLGKLRGKLAIVWYDEGGNRHRVATGASNPIEAARFLEQFVRQQQIAKPKIYTVGELWEAYRASLGNRPSAKTMDFEWRKMKGRFSDLLPSQITEEVTEAHIKERREAGRKDGTIWTELGRLRMVFAWAVKKKRLEAAPHIERPPKPAPRDLHLTRPEMHALLKEAAFPHMRLFMIMAWTTGARSGAILDLTWDRVFFDRGFIKLANVDIGAPMKGRATVPINDTLRAALLEAEKGALTDYVIEWAGGRVRSIKKGFKAVGVKAGFPWVSAHVLRHSAAIAMAEDGIPMSEIAQFLGHGDSRITERVYAKFSPKHLRKAANSLELTPIV